MTVGKNGKYGAKIMFLIVVALLLVYVPVFSQNQEETYTDKRDGNTYKVIIVGKQKWMAENLRYLPRVFPVDEGYIDDLPCYVYGYSGYDIDSAKQSESYATYGVLYGWMAAKKACPFGWRLPTEKDWAALEDTLGVEQLGSRLSEKSEKWDDGNMKKSERWGETGFNAVPAGYRDGNRFYAEQGMMAYFWTADKVKVYYSYYRFIDSDETYFGHESGLWENGYSVRCVKDLNSKKLIK
ncbi:MAG: hypothetical protein J6W06_07785 [Bacteroidales bacterium]|nr:hypothetical protein [Bacteroidales bacterium]